MKTTITVLFFLFALSAKSFAGTTINTEELPTPAKQVIQEYFVGSQVLSAKKDKDDGVTTYEVKIQHKAIKLEVDVSGEGKILDVDMDN